MRKGVIDETDDRILASLKQDADVSMERLREILDVQYDIGLTRQAIQARVTKLKTKEILKIKGIVNEEKLGREVLAFVLVSFIPGGEHSQRELANQIAGIPDVDGVWIIAGDWDILLKVRGSSIEEIGSLVIDRIRSIQGVGKTITCACFGSIKEEY